MPSSRTWRSCGMVSSDVTRITPSVSWLASALVQLAGRALPCRTDETAAPIAWRGAPVLHAAQDLHRPRAVQAVEDQVDQAGPAAAARARALILRSPSSRSTQRPGVGRDVRAAVDDLGHRGQRYACLGGDGGQGRPGAPASRRLPARSSSASCSARLPPSSCRLPLPPHSQAAASLRRRPRYHLGRSPVRNYSIEYRIQSDPPDRPSSLACAAGRNSRGSAANDQGQIAASA